jgi:hypothetical protein
MCAASPYPIIAITLNAARWMGAATLISVFLCAAVIERCRVVSPPLSVFLKPSPPPSSLY